MSKEIAGFLSKDGTPYVYTEMLDKHQRKMELTPVYKGTPEAKQFDSVIDIEAEVVETPKRTSRNKKSLIPPKED